MPYAIPRAQISLKFTAAEFTSLQAAAAHAGVPVNTYARHLVVHRAAQPLSARAEAVRQYYLVREQVWREKLDAYQAAAQQLPLLQQQVQALQEQLRVLAEAKSRQDLLDEIPALFRAAVLRSLPDLTMPPDAFASSEPAE